MRSRLLLALALLAAQPAFAAGYLGNLDRQVFDNAVEHGPGQAAVARTGATVTGRPAPARIRFDDGTPFPADYMADYWSRIEGEARGATPSEDAPGHILIKPDRFGGAVTEPGAPQLQRKLEAVFLRVLSHPALAHIRGASLRPGGSIGHEGGAQRHALAGKAVLLAHPLNLADPNTKKFADGSYHTPGEAPVMKISVNDPDELYRREPIGSWNGMIVLRGGYMLVIPNTERPLYVRGADGRQVLNPQLIDATRPRADIQFMTVYVGTDSSEHSEIVRQRVLPTSGVGRLVGVLYNTDWRSLLREVNDPR